MAHIIELPTHSDHRGSLTVMEKVLPFAVKRIYWIHQLSENGPSRGKHRHLQTQQAMVCLQGKCSVVIKKYQQEEIFYLDNPQQILLLPPEDWHEMKDFQENPIIVVMASHDYMPEDYILEPL